MKGTDKSGGLGGKTGCTKQDQFRAIGCAGIASGAAFGGKGARRMRGGREQGAGKARRVHKTVPMQRYGVHGACKRRGSQRQGGAKLLARAEGGGWGAHNSTRLKAFACKSEVLGGKEARCTVERESRGAEGEAGCTKQDQCRGMGWTATRLHEAVPMFRHWVHGACKPPALSWFLLVCPSYLVCLLLLNCLYQRSCTCPAPSLLQPPCLLFLAVVLICGPAFRTPSLLLLVYPVMYAGVDPQLLHCNCPGCCPWHACCVRLVCA